MGLCAGESKRRKPYKTIIIPRGTINPNEHNVIEIPLNLETNSSLIVRAPNDSSAAFQVEAYRGDFSNLTGRNFPNQVSQSYAPHFENQQPVFYQTPTQSFQPTPIASTATFYDAPTTSAAPISYMPNYTPSVPTTSTAPSYMPSYTPSVPMTSAVPSYMPSYTPSAPMTTAAPSYMPNYIPSAPATRPVPNYMPSYNPPVMPEQPHSPLCPICSRASCKYFDRPTYNYCSSRPEPPCFSTRPDYVSMYLSKSRERIENDMMGRILDEKLEKLLKPVLMNLARNTTEDDEYELSYTCEPKYSFTCEPKRSITCAPSRRVPCEPRYACEPRSTCEPIYNAPREPVMGYPCPYGPSREYEQEMSCPMPRRPTSYPSRNNAEYESNKNSDFTSSNKDKYLSDKNTDDMDNSKLSRRRNSTDIANTDFNEDMGTSKLIRRQNSTDIINTSFREPSEPQRENPVATSQKEEANPEAGTSGNDHSRRISFAEKGNEKEPTLKRRRSFFK